MLHRAVLILSLAVLSASMSVLPAATFESTVLEYRVDAPPGWSGALSSNKTSIRLSCDEEPELSVTFHGKKVRGSLKGSQVVQQFKARYRAKKKTEAKVVVTIKPSRTTVGSFKAIHYGFRWRDFIDEVLEERTVWFNARRPDDDTLLLFKVDAKGPARAMKSHGEDIEYILASFTLIEKEVSPPQPARPGPTPEPSTVTPATHTIAGPAGPPPSGGGTSASGSSNSASGAITPIKRANSGPGREEGGTGAFVITNERKSSSDYSKYFGRIRKRNVAGLMSNAKRIEDPERLARLNKTFHDRNTARTAEQKNRARMYFGGAGRSADVR